MDPPSGLPNFAGLAAEVASILQSPLNPEDDEWKDQLDTFMVVMNEDDGVDAHVSDDLIDACSVEVGRFLTHLMKNTSGQFWGGYDLVPKLKRLVANPGDWKSLREAVLRLSIDLP